MTLLSKIFKAYLYSSVHVSLIGAIIIFAGTYNFRFGIAAFFSILLFYNFQRILRIKNFQKIQGNLHLEWISKNLTEIIFMIFFAGIISYLLLPKISKVGIFSILAITFLYFFLRKIIILKNLFIAFAWVLMPKYFEIHFDNNGEVYQYFTYVLFLSILYDSKDLKDKYTKHYYLVILSALISVFFQFFAMINEGQFIAYQSIVILTTIGLTCFFYKPRHYLYYLFWIDFALLALLPLINPN